MNQGFFVTGTDTGVGKTLISTALIHALRDEGLRVSGMKPVASGCIDTDYGRRNEDADRLFQAANVSADYDLICPYRFMPPIAPHIAAQEEGIDINTEHILQCYQKLQSCSDAVVVEGVGGWQVPIKEDQFMSDLAVLIGLPVIIVVGARLGCINHALLTAANVLASGLAVAGWVYNQLDPDMQQLSEVKQSLQRYMPATMLAEILFQHDPDIEAIASSISFPGNT